MAGTTTDSLPSTMLTREDVNEKRERSELKLLSVVIPAQNEESCIASTLEHLSSELERHGISNEIIVVDDGSEDGTWKVLTRLKKRMPNLKPVSSQAPRGFGGAVVQGLNQVQGDAIVIMMADESDDCRDVVRYWNVLREGYDCVFGSRFIRGGGVSDYPFLKLLLNRPANWFLMFLFNIRLNDTTNAFKGYRRGAIDGCRPLIALDFSLTIELPLKAIVRGYTWKTIPVTWRNRQTGVSKLKIREMGGRYLSICFSILREKYFYHAKFSQKEVPAPEYK